MSNSDNFPLILLPPALQQAVNWADKIPLLPPQLDQLQPPPPQPSRVNWRSLVIELVAAGVAPKLAQLLLQIGDYYAEIATMVLLGGITLRAWEEWRGYSNRLNKHKAAMEKYERYKVRYYEKKLAYYQQVEAVTSPNLKQTTKQERLASILIATKPPDNFCNDARRGRSEGKFKKHLEQWFGRSIHEGATVSQKSTTSDRCCTADFVYIDKAIGLHIDIEVDEPYIYNTTDPIHYIGKDEWRNELFLGRGWPVIRFCEEQVVRFPDACCKEIAQLIALVTVRQEIFSQFHNVSALPRIKRWTKAEAKQMAQQKYREHYKDG